VADTLSSLDRRKLLYSSAVIATVAVAGSWIYSLVYPTPRADADRRPRRPRRANITNVNPEELMKPGPLPELVMGKADAPITIVEYASLTCGHCANFHNKVLPVIKEKYIETGKVRLVFREFPRDDRDAIAYMSARCAGGDKTLPLISMLFSRQDDWVGAKNVDDLRTKLFAFGQQTGMTKQAFDACIPHGKQKKLTSTQDKLLKSLLTVRDRAYESYGVGQTPTFFINGKKFTGGSVEDFEKALAPLLKG
jgi:protein-disulfide isomerase